MVQNSFTHLVLKKLLIFILIFRIINCPNSFAADGQHCIRIERPKANSLLQELGKSEHPPLYVLSFRICLPAGRLPRPIASLLLPTRRL